MVHNQVVIRHRVQLSHLPDMDHHRQINKAIHLRTLRSRISHQVVNNNNQDNMAVLVHNQIISSLRPKRHLKTHMLLDSPEVILLPPRRHTRTMSHHKIIHHLRQLARLNPRNLDLSKTRVRSPIMLANQVQVPARRSTVPPLHLRHLAPPPRAAAIPMPKAVNRQARRLPRRRHTHRIVVRHRRRRAEATHPQCRRPPLDILFIKHHIRHRTLRIHRHRISRPISHRTPHISHLTSQLISHPINHPRINHRTSHHNNLSNSHKQLRRHNNNRLRVQLRVDFSRHLVHRKALPHHQDLNNNPPMGLLLRKHMFHRLQEGNHRYCSNNLYLITYTYLVLT